MAAAPLRKRLLVTGAAGFVGRHAMSAFAASEEYDVLGIGRGSFDTLPRGASFYSVDLEEAASLQTLIAGFGPTHILHLAGQASIGYTPTGPLGTWRANVTALMNLVEAVQFAAPTATFLFVSSGEVYGRAFLNHETVVEDITPLPAGTYARTKLVGEEMLSDIFANSGVRSIVLRPFNHTGPGQDERFVVASFASQIARIEAGLAPPQLMVGNLDAKRDFLDARDVVRAYASVIANSEAIAHGTVFNVASGEPRTIAEILAELRGLARVPFEAVAAPDRQRPSEIAIAAGNAQKLRDTTGWAPVIPWRQTLTDILNAARQACAARP